MRKSKRIQTIADMVSSGHAVCDVGCDHAYTSIILVGSGKCPFAVASDVRPGPLMAASKNIEDAGLADRITVCLADGVPDDVHDRLPDGKKTLVITGMGGGLICRILEKAGETAAAFDEMILSPQSDPDLVRLKADDMGYGIVDEEMLIDEGKYYTIIRMEKRERQSQADYDSESPVTENKAASFTGKERNTDSSDSDDPGRRAEYLYGPVLLRKRHPVLYEFLKRREKICEMIFENLRRAGRNPEDGRFREVVREMEVLHEAERYYQDDRG